MGILDFIRQVGENNRAFDDAISDLCREAGVPDVPFDLQAAVRSILAGTWPNLPDDGSWWVATGIEVVGLPARRSRTRLLFESTARDAEAVGFMTGELFATWGGPSAVNPNLAAKYFTGSFPGQKDILYARVTGRMRPIGAWLVAVPPWLIRSRA